jgi:class 3 adenylate cyclase/predicted ATPase
MQQVADWLKGLGLERYEQLFAENYIDADVLCDLTDHDLEKLGVPLGHRKKLMRAIVGLDKAPEASTEAASPAAVPRDTAERRQLTVMFCDLVGSTALSTKLDPEDLRGIINAHHRCCTDLVESNDGFVAKYMGDGVLAYFGYPQAHEHDAERAVRAALALVEAVPKLATTAGSPLAVRVGIATGLVVVGDLIGTGAAREQAVVGETPNLAARLQALAEPGAVMIAAGTHRLTGGLFEYRDFGAVTLKGFGEPVPVWQVLGAGTAESRFEALRATTTPLVGRDEEIDLLMRRWEQAKRGDGQVVLICGEPGIGKSRVAQTIVERIGAEPHTRLRYFCSPHHQDSTLYPSIAQLERATGFRRDDAPEERLDKLEAVLARATNDLREAAPLVADLLGIPAGDRYPPLNLMPLKRKERTLAALIGQIAGLAASQPVLIVFEDVHWADPTTRELLDLIIDRIAALRVLIVITFRPEFTPPWLGRPHVTALTLSRLPPRQRAEIIGHVTGGKALPKEIADQIVDRTDGIPLFIEELTKTVVETGIVTDAGGRYAAAGPVPALAIPSTLHASLLARLDHLAPTREVAQVGAALGRTFSHELISAAAGMPQAQVDDALVQLVGAGLMFRRGIPPDAEYSFKHALVQDAAYGTLLRSRRQQIHARIAAALESRFPDTVLAQPGLMAFHCTEAALEEKAIGYWLEAGRQAVARSLMLEAEAASRKGLDLLTGFPESAWRQQQELELLTVRGPALIAAQGYSAPSVGETFARASGLARLLGNSDYLIPLLYGQWAYHVDRSEHNLALPLARQMQQIGEERRDETARLLGRCMHGFLCLNLGEIAAARALLEQCHDMNDPTRREMYVRLTGADQYVIMLVYLGATLTYLGHVDQGRARLDEALSAARKLGHAYTLAFVVGWKAIMAGVSRSPREAWDYAEQVEALSSEHGFPFWSSVGQLFRGWASAELTKAADGIGLTTNGLAAYRGMGSVYNTPLLLLLLAKAHAALGSPSEGLARIAEAEQIIVATDERFNEADLHCLRAVLLNTTGDAAAAEQSYQRALGVAARQSAKLFELRAATGLARLWRDRGKRAEAHDLLAPVYGWFTEGFGTVDLNEAKALLDHLK